MLKILSKSKPGLPDGTWEPLYRTGRDANTYQSGGLDAVGEGPDLLGAEQRLSLVLLVALEDGVARLLADGAGARPQEHLVHRIHRRAERLLGEV